MPRTSHYRKIYQKKKRFAVFRLLLFMGAGAALACGTAAAGLFVYYARDLPRPEKFTERALAQPVQIYDRTGTVLLYEAYGGEKREVVALSDIAPVMQQAVIATEDAGFYSHVGVSLRGTARAVLINLRLLPVRTRLQSAQGGSTISQQLIRSTFLTNEKTIGRKIREIILTLELERRYSKNEILEFYLNQVPLGPHAYGVAAASQLYFHKQPSELSPEEAAVLAALIQAPSYYSPYGEHLRELLERKNYVLGRMVKVGFLTEEQRLEIQAKEIVFYKSASVIKAPHFVLYVLGELEKKYEKEFLQQSAFRVRTTLDWELQRLAEKVVGEGAQRNQVLNAHNAALVALTPQTGEVLAMVGSKDWFGEPYPEGCAPGKDCLFDPQVNVATFAQGRQPGSAFKPFVYVTAFQKGYDDRTVVVDELTNFGVWGGKEYIPQNYDSKFRGPVTLRQGLAQSLNIPSIKVLMDLAGLQDSVATAKEMGITTLSADPSFYGPALVLGGGEVRLLELVSAYGVFATEGKRVPPLTILEITDSFGRTVEKNSHSPIQILSPEHARLLTDILSDNEARTPIFGPRSALFFPDRRVAAKTGTTQEFKDAWTIGYTPEIAVGVWAGNNNGAPIHKKPGATVAAPMWRAFMDGFFQRALRVTAPERSS